MESERVVLNAFWRERPISAGEYIATCRTFLAALPSVSSVFADRCIVIGNRPVILPSDEASFQKVMLSALAEEDYAFENPDPSNHELTTDSRLSQGFSFAFSDPDPHATEQTAASILVKAGAYGGVYSPTNSVTIKIPPTYRSLWEDREKARQLMFAVLEHWKPEFAMITSYELRRALDPKRVNDFSVGPLTYFADENAARIAKGKASVETTSGGGTLLSIDAPPPWANALDRFKDAYAALDKAGFLNWRSKHPVESGVDKSR